MTEFHKSFSDYLKEVPNPASGGKTKGSLEEFRRYANEITQVALAHTGLELVEYDVREYDPRRISERLKEIELSTYSEIKRSLGKNEMHPRKNDEKKEENHE